MGGGDGGGGGGDLGHNGASRTVNPLKSSIEIELINEPGYLKTKWVEECF